MDNIRSMQLPTNIHYLSLLWHSITQYIHTNYKIFATTCIELDIHTFVYKPDFYTKGLHLVYKLRDEKSLLKFVYVDDTEI